MARKALQFRNLPKEAFTSEMVELLEAMDKVKAQINAEIMVILDKAQPGISKTHRAVHSYKLDFDTKERELKVALVEQAKPKEQAPKQSLGDWLAGMQASGRGC